MVYLPVYITLYSGSVHLIIIIIIYKTPEYKVVTIRHPETPVQEEPYHAMEYLYKSVTDFLIDNVTVVFLNGTM